MKKMERTQAIAEKVDRRKGVNAAEGEEDTGESDVDIPRNSKGKKVGVDEPISDDEEPDEDEVWKVCFVPKQWSHNAERRQ